MPSTPIPKKILARQHEITADFTRLVHAHVADLVAGRATEALEIRDFAGQLCLHPTHLSNTIRLATGEAACAIYERALLAAAQTLLLDPRLPVGAVAARLTYDPSNFTKFFKHFTGRTPRQFREDAWAQQRAAPAEAAAEAAKPEVVTKKTGLLTSAAAPAGRTFAPSSNP